MHRVSSKGNFLATTLADHLQSLQRGLFAIGNQDLREAVFELRMGGLEGSLEHVQINRPVLRCLPDVAETEINEINPELAVEYHVGSRQVSMDDSSVMDVPHS